MSCKCVTFLGLLQKEPTEQRKALTSSHVLREKCVELNGFLFKIDEVDCNGLFFGILACYFMTES